MPEKKYYSVEFFYPGPYKGCECKKSALACAKADIKASKTLDALSLRHRSQYSFPDGSLYRYVVSEMGAEKLKEYIQSKLPRALKVVSVTRELAGKAAFSNPGITLEEYMDEGAE